MSSTTLNVAAIMTHRCLVISDIVALANFAATKSVPPTGGGIERDSQIRRHDHTHMYEVNLERHSQWQEQRRGHQQCRQGLNENTKQDQANIEHD